MRLFAGLLCALLAAPVAAAPCGGNLADFIAAMKVEALLIHDVA